MIRRTSPMARARIALVGGVVLVAMTACSSTAEPLAEAPSSDEPSPNASISAEDRTFLHDEAAIGDSDVSFDDGATLSGASPTWSNGLSLVYDWEVVRADEIETVFENVIAGCDVIDVVDPTAPADVGDRAATLALIESLSGYGELAEGPSRSMWGLGKGMGEDGGTYDVLQAVFRQGDDITFVSARAFSAARAQHYVAVTCQDPDLLERTRAQLVQVSYLNL